MYPCITSGKISSIVLVYEILFCYQDGKKDMSKIFKTCHTVWFCNHGRNDMKGVVQSHTRKECTQYIMWTAEDMMRKIRIANEQKPEGAEKINSIFFFIDIEGLPMKQLTCKAGFIKYKFKTIKLKSF